ncbi:MAG TPA: transglutaminase domain-containing protein [Bacteroidales bacterium]
MQTDYFVALENNSMVYSLRYYSGHSSELKDFKIKKSSSDIQFRKRCGDYEINGIFFHDHKQCIYKLDFPKAGDNAWISTTIEQGDSRYLSKIFFNEENFLRSGEISLIIPEEIDIDILEFNLENFNISKEISDKGYYSVVTYKLNNLESLDYENIAGPSWIFPHIIVLSKGFKRGDDYVSLFDSNKSLYKWLYDLLPEYYQNQAIEQIVQKLNVENAPDSVKLQAALNWVHENIRYIAFEDGIAGFKPSPVEQVLNDKYADCKGMTNLLYFILKDMGFDARRCWIGTDRLAYSYKFPSLASDNHVICAVQTDSGFIFIDPTDRYSIIGEPSEYIQSRLIAIENEGNTIIDSIPAGKFDINGENILSEVSLDSSILNISSSIFYRGVNRKEIQYFIYEVFGSDKQEYLQNIVRKFNSKLTVDTLQFKSIGNGSVFEIQFEMQGKNMVFNQAGKQFIPLDYDYSSNLKPIDTSRKVHFCHDNRMRKDYSTVFYLNENQHVDYLPQDSSLVYNGFAFYFSWKQENNKIIYNKRLDLKDRIIEVKDFADWNTFVDEYNKLQAELIIISNQNEGEKN